MRENRNFGKGPTVLGAFLLVIFVVVFLINQWSWPTFWGGRTTVVLDDPLTLVSYDSIDGLTVLTVPSNYLLVLPEGAGDLVSKSLKSYMQLEQKDGKWLKKLVMMNFSLGVDGWIQGDTESALGIGVNDEQLQLLWSGDRLARMIRSRSDLVLWDKIYLWNSWTTAQSSSVLDLGQLGLATRMEAVDEFELIQGHKSKLIAFGMRNFRDSLMSEEGLSVVVTNSSNVPGLATMVGQIIQVTGVKVVWQKANEEQDFGCEISAVPSAVESETFRHLKRWFDCQVSEKVPDRGEISIKLGRGFANSWWGRVE